MEGERATINQNFGPSHEQRFVSREEFDRAGHFLRLRDPAQRRHLCHLCPKLIRHLQHAGIGRPRRKCVATDIIARPSAVALPMPFAAPVKIARRPWSRPVPAIVMQSAFRGQPSMVHAVRAAKPCPKDYAAFPE